MVSRSGRKIGGRRNRFNSVENPGLKTDNELREAEKHSRALRRFVLFLVTVALLAVGIASACGVRLF